MTNAASHLRRGFTLVEMVLSMAVMTILLGGIASAMILASRAMPDLATPLKAMADGYYVADQLAGELYAAQTISTTFRSATGVEFTVADRNNDSIAETIRYSWGGAGQPLTRQYNNGVASAVLNNVYQFNLGYVTQVISGATKVTVVNITTRVGADATSRVDTSVQLLNQPS